MNGPTIRPASEIERLEDAIVAHLSERLGNNVAIRSQPDQFENADLPPAPQIVLVHFAGTSPAAAGAQRVRLGGSIAFALICLSRSLKGSEGSYALVERVERAIAGEAFAGAAEFTVRRSRLEGQSGGLWRYVIEVETQMPRGRVAAPTAPFIPGFTKGNAE